MFKFLNIKFLIIFLFFLLITGYLFVKLFPKNEKNVVKIGKAVFYVEMARTGEEKAKGLAGHKPLSKNEGMLFEFPAGDGFGFWMKGMTFPIDIIWIKNNKVIYAVENAQPPKAGQKESELQIFAPSEGANYVLEVGAGMADKYKIKTGDIVKFEIFNF